MKHPIHPNQLTLFQSLPAIETITAEEDNVPRDVIFQPSYKNCTETEALQVATAQAKAYNDAATDEFLCIGDVFEMDGKDYKLTAFQCQPLFIESELFIELFYQFANVDDESDKVRILNSDLVAKFQKQTCIPKHPDDLHYFVNAAIPGTKEFNAELKLEMDYYKNERI